MKTPKIKPTNGWAVVDKNGNLWGIYAPHRYMAIKEISTIKLLGFFERNAPFTVVPVTITQRKAKP